MLLLGIDTSGKNASAAVYDTESEIFSAQTSVYTKMTHSQIIMPMCHELLGKIGAQLSDIGEIAVAVGPGSYTGLRIGVAAVKALCFGLNIPCCGVSTLEAAAYGNIAFDGNICTVMKARGELVYTALYKSNGYELETVGGEKIITRNELAEYLAFEGNQALLCGDGGAEFFQKFGSHLLKIAPPHMRIQNAQGVCLAAMHKESIDPHLLEPSYLQKVQAEKELEENMKLQSSD